MKDVCFVAVATISMVMVISAASVDHGGVVNLSDVELSHSKNAESNHSAHEHHQIHVASWQFDYVRQPLVVSLFMISVVLAKLAFHHADFLSSWMPESCVLILLGVGVGGILHAAQVVTDTSYYIEPTTFFLFLLPPCILEAAYGLHDPVFFANLGTVLLYAVIGTVINCFLIGPILYGLAICGAMGPIVNIRFIECLLFASLIVAVDPVAVLAIFQEIGVNNVLYFLVFGESLLNDAVTVVLYNTVNTLSKMEEIPMSQIALAFAAFFSVSIGGLSIGLVFGIFSAFITKITNHVRAVETLAIFSLAYASYLTAELFHFSGIISMIGCGLMQVRYAFHNISHNSSITVKYFTKMLSGACDSIIFMFLGIALVRDDHRWHTGFVLWSTFLCLIVRFVVTYGLTLFANKTYRERKVDYQEQFIMAYGGLRGAVAFCLVAMLDSGPLPNKFMFQTTTLFIVLFTVFIQGISIKPLVKLLRIKGEQAKVISLYQEINDHVLDHMLVFMEEVIGHYGHNSVKEFIDKMDDKYFKRWLQRDPLTKDELIMELYQEIALQQHFENIYGFDTSSSHLELYRPQYQDFAQSKVEIPMHPDVMRRSMDYAYSRNFLNRSRTQKSRIGMESESIDEEAQDHVYDTVKSLPAAMVKSDTSARPDMHRFMSVSERGKPHAEKAKSVRRKTRFFGKVEEDDVFKANPTSNDLRRWMIKSPNKDAFSRHADRNMTIADDNELLNLLHEKQLRHNRFMRAQSVYSPPQTRHGSMGESLHEVPGGSSEQEPGTRMRHKTTDEIVPKDRVRMRHKTVDFGRQGDKLRYVPRYVPKRDSAARVTYHAPETVTLVTEPSTSQTTTGSSRTRSGSFDGKVSATSFDKKTVEFNYAKSKEPSKEPIRESSDETAGLLARKSEDSNTKSVSQKGRGQLKRQDADGSQTPASRNVNT